MSLINDMLKDLEKRPKEPLDPNQLLTGIGINAAMSIKKNKISYSLILFLLLLLSVIVIIGAAHKKMQLRHQQIQTASAQNEVAPNQIEKTQADPLETRAPTLMTGVALQLQDSSSSLRFMLNDKVDYHFNQDKQKNELTIVFNNTQLYSALPQIDYQGSGIETLQAFTDENKNLKLVIKLSGTTQVKNVQLVQSGKAPELQVDLVYPNELVASSVNSKAAAPALNVAPLKKPTDENYAEQEYEQASNLASNDKISEAVEVLKATLAHFPGHVKARELLASLLIQEKDYVSADKLLADGLNANPTMDSFLELKAKSLTEQGKPKEALAELIGNAPPLAQDPEYFSFMAALYEQTGQHEQAASLYRQLIAADPNNPKWWLGLGIALDGEGNNNQAFEAYANARNMGGLNPELQAYIDTRLHSA